MSIKKTKFKNISSSKTFSNRLARLERILQQFIQLSENGTQNTLPSTSNSSKSPLSDLLKSSPSSRKTGNIIQSSTPIIRSVNRGGADRNSLLLSQGQIIAELSAAIIRASRRNS